MNITDDAIDYYQQLPDEYYGLPGHWRDWLDGKVQQWMQNGVSIDRAVDEIAEAIRLYNIMAARLGVEL